MSQDKKSNVNCYKCKYFVVTWNPQFPRSCSFFGFKTRGEMPSIAVRNSSGEPCGAFEKKPGVK